MNLRIVSFLSSESEEDVKELVADFAEALLARGYANDVDDTSSPMKSLIVVRENEEVLNGAPEEYFQSELSNALMTVIPTDATGKYEQPENLSEDIAHDIKEESHMTEAEKGWLAGLFDGEGCVSLGRNHNVINYRIGIEMTCEETINHAIKLLQTEEIYPTTHNRIRKYRNSKPQYSLRIQKAIDGLNLCKLMLPYSITKRKNWQLLLEFGESRIDLTRINDDGKLKPLGIKSPITEYQWGIFEQIRKLNLRGINV